MAGDHGPARSAARSQREPELFRPSHPRLLRQHDTSCAACAPSLAAAAASDAQLRAALATTRGEHGPAGPGAHPQPEAMDLRPPTIVRLERTLAHWSSRCSSDLLHNDGPTLPYAAQPGSGPVAAADAGFSLLTVKAIPAQVKPGPSRRRPASATAMPPVRSPERGLSNLPVLGSTIVEHCGFPNASPAGDLGCGKSTSAELRTFSRRPLREGKPRLSVPRHAQSAPRHAGDARCATCTPCGPLCGQPSMVTGQALQGSEARGAHR